jgi:signal transduction histidine kinase
MNRTHNGTGLGLPLSKAMIELHDGSLHIESVPQAGTEVSLTFPPHRVVIAAAPAQLRVVR